MSTAIQQAIPVGHLDAEVRATFILRTYAHLIGAILAFLGVEIFLFSQGYAEAIAIRMMGTNWLLILGGFMVVGWFASHTAHRNLSPGTHYLAFAAYILAYAILFVPMLYMAQMKAPGTIESAAGVTLMGVVGLTVVAFVTRKDFSFLRSVLVWGGVLAIVAIIASVLFGAELGTWFSVAMIGFAGAAVLYDTSNILRHYPVDRHVAAALDLFGSIALMFWYVLRLFLSRD
jgi:FtsH-binding integral membrane protein